MVNVSLCLGMLIMYVLGSLFHDWRLLNWILIAPHVISFLWVAVESPATPFYLLESGRKDEAAKNLQKLRGEDYDITEELKEMVERCETIQETEKKVGESKIKHLMNTVFTKRFLKPFSIVGGLYCILTVPLDPTFE